SEIADRLEKSSDLAAEVQQVLKEIVSGHKRIIFNGNNYSEDWVLEAEKRGLPNIRSTVEAIKALTSEKNIKVFEKHKVLNRSELHSRYEINLELYIKTINIEALTMIDMARRQILPAVINYTGQIANSIHSIKATGLNVDISAQTELLTEVSTLCASLKNAISSLEKAVEAASASHGDTYDHACMFKDLVFTKMNELRAIADKLETLVDAKLWPFPTYGDLLYNI
ncbi:MAG: glutamine synthetase type III, partial [Clostridiaceae bacterium]|nr:glutamine synthetase type III [Clostridiaceae bacterium]